MWPSPEVRQLCQPSDRLCLELMPNPRPWCLEKALVSLCSLNGVLYLLASTERVLGLLVWINAGGSHMSSEVALQCTQPPWGLSLSGIYCLILLVSRSNQCKYADVLSCARLLEMGRWCWWTLILRQNTLANRPSESCRFETHCYPVGFSLRLDPIDTDAIQSLPRPSDTVTWTANHHIQDHLPLTLASWLILLHLAKILAEVLEVYDFRVH